jgi:hypothetical protein
MAADRIKASFLIPNLLSGIANLRLQGGNV